jgi:rod shape-determining protein MreC
MSAPGRTANGLGRGASLGLRAGLLACLSLSLMYFDHRHDHLDRMRDGLSVAVYPLQLLVDAPFRSWSWVREVTQAQDALLAANRQLEREARDASVKLLRLESLETENARLRALLDSSVHVADRVLVAEILSVALDPYHQRFRLNRGSIDDVYVGQALLDAKGIVGQIVSVGPLSSEAVLITDADHAVPVFVNRNGLRSIAVGSGDSGYLRLPYLTNNADVQVGDLLVSSGLGGVFPPGYPVARVLEVRERPGQSFADIVAAPMAELDREREVMLVWSAREAPQPAIARSDGELP